MNRTGNCTPEEMLLRVLRVAEMILKQEAANLQRDSVHPNHDSDQVSTTQKTPAE